MASFVGVREGRGEWLREWLREFVIIVQVSKDRHC